MNVIVENWMLIVALACVLAFVISLIINFIKLPNNKKIEAVKEWLKWAVVEAEKALGSQTGQLKLRFVYDLFVQRFPEVAKFISFETFSGWVDEALEWMKNQLESNDAVKCYINTLLH